MRIIVYLLLIFNLYDISFNIDRMKILKNAKCTEFIAKFNPKIIPLNK